MKEWVGMGAGGVGTTLSLGPCLLPRATLG